MEPDLKKLFSLAEETIIQSSSWKRESFLKSIQWTKDKSDYRSMSEQDVWIQLLSVVFYSGIKADMVMKKIPAIKEHLGDYLLVKDFTQADIDKFLADKRVIRNRKKLQACIHNAKVLYQLSEKYGSFTSYIDSIGASNIDIIRNDLRQRFKYLGPRTSLHLMMELGLPVLKPDLVICRMFTRLGLIDDEKQLDQAVEVGTQFAWATGHPIRYIDIVFVMLGQAANTSTGIEKGVCLGEHPRCSACKLTDYCVYYKTLSGSSRDK